MSTVILGRPFPAANSMTRSAVRTACLLLCVLLLSACGHSRVVDREDGNRRVAGRGASSRPAPSGAATYVVQRGDTLYGIAFRNGLDFRDVAALNRIPAPYTIYPGQRLALRANPVAVRPTSTRRPSATAPVRSAATSPRTPTVVPHTTTRPPVSTGSAGLPAASGSAAGPAAAPAGPATPSPASIGPGGWRWPTQGTLIGRFAAGDPKRQGLDIAGVAGQAVVAAADGVVVYSGAGLVGYGELIIVKHSDEWLSAYAHNRLRLVTEGIAVKGGQPIAEMGRSGTSRDMLHFEVRRNGKPVDPLTVLPAR